MNKETLIDDGKDKLDMRIVYEIGDEVCIKSCFDWLKGKIVKIENDVATIEFSDKHFEKEFLRFCYTEEYAKNAI